MYADRMAQIVFAGGEVLQVVEQFGEIVRRLNEAATGAVVPAPPDSGGGTVGGWAILTPERGEPVYVRPEGVAYVRH